MTEMSATDIPATGMPEPGTILQKTARGAGWIENAPTMNASSAGTNPAR